MKKYLLFSLLIFSYSVIQAQKFSVSGGEKSVLYESPDADSGLDTIAVLYGMDNAAITFESNNNSPMSWFKYTTNPFDRLPLPGNQVGNKTTLSSGIQPNCGYGVTVGSNTYYIWLFDYTQYVPSSVSISSANDNLCEEVLLNVVAPKYSMKYIASNSAISYTVKNRNIPLKYKTMKFDEGAKKFVDEEQTIVLSELIANPRIVEAPLRNTTFTLGDDRFALQWGLSRTIVSEDLPGNAVKAESDAKHVVRDVDNEVDKEIGDLGGSAPVDLEFKAFANEPVAAYYTWQIASDKEFKNILATYPDKELRYTFHTYGKYSVRLLVSNNSNSCVDSSQVYEDIEITDSKLLAPNAFSPNGDGKNDEFKVMYKSILSFEGWIFNRWGNELFHWSDPTKGWDGKAGGKYVTPGVYFYIFEATGSDGVKYKLKGSVNVFSKKE
jgi:gliding motility-associated-like protein